MKTHLVEYVPCTHSHGRRALLKSAGGLVAMGVLGGFTLTAPEVSFAAAMSKEARDKLSPGEIIAGLKQGNERFRNGKMHAQNYFAQARATASGQFPAAAILGCIDSRAAAEIILDARLGDLFNARVAGNVVNDDMIGSLEFACAVAGAKVIVVMGHTACGAIKGAIDNAELGNLTGLLAKIKPAVAATRYTGERTSNNYAFVDAVARKNVELTVANIRRDSPVLAAMETGAAIKIAGAMYNLDTGVVDFFAD
jgi:carbonic anhydrase